MDYEKLALYSEVISSILFAVAIVWLFVKFIAPAVAAVQTSRNEEISAAERRRDDAKAELERVRAEKAGAATGIAEMRARGNVEAGRERERLIAEARAEGERVVRNADGELERARAAGRAEFQARLINRALEQARDRAKNEVSVSVDRDVTDLFLQSVNNDKRDFAVAGEVSNA